MIRQVIDYVKNENFQVYFDNDYLNIQNFIDINYMEEDKISIKYNDGNIKIIGKKISVIKLLDKEILIKGTINNIEIRRNNE